MTLTRKKLAGLVLSSWKNIQYFPEHMHDTAKKELVVDKQELFLFAVADYFIQMFKLGLHV